MARLPISVTIIALNEEQTIAACIRSVSWADDVVVIDAGSSDRTVALSEENGARVVHQKWLGYGAQKNFAQSQARHDWILNIDADERVPDALRIEIEAVLLKKAQEPVVLGPQGYEISRRNYFLGKWIRFGGWYPNYLVRLSYRPKSRWTEPSVHESLKVEGSIERLTQPLDHYSFRSLASQVETNLRFSQLGTDELRKRGVQGSIMLLLTKPVGKWIETYLLKQGFRDGLYGFIISVNAAHSIFLKYAGLLLDHDENSNRR